MVTRIKSKRVELAKSSPCNIAVNGPRDYAIFLVSA